MKKIILGFSLIALLLVLPAGVPLFGLLGEKAEPKNIVVFLLLTIVFTLSAGILWVWMILDYKTNKKYLKHRILWGLGLFIANWAAAVIYFIIIYFPRVKHTND